MIILSGKTASGKSSVMRILSKSYGFKPIVSYTTRPIRKNEVNEIDYHFVSKFTFFKMILTKKFIEWFSYKTIKGRWYYGSAEADYIEDNSIIILTPEGVRSIKERCSDDLNIKVFYLKANTETLIKRALNRGDNINEVLRRSEQDDKDFFGFDPDYTIEVEGKSLKEIAEEIVNIYKLNSEK